MKDKVMEFVDYLDHVRETKGMLYFQLENLAGLQLNTWAQSVQCRKAPTLHRLINVALALDHRLNVFDNGVLISSWDKSKTGKQLSDDFLDMFNEKRKALGYSINAFEIAIGLGKSVWYRYKTHIIYPSCETIFKVANAFGYEVTIDET